MASISFPSWINISNLKLYMLWTSRPNGCVAKVGELHTVSASFATIVLVAQRRAIFPLIGDVRNVRQITHLKQEMYVDTAKSEQRK